MCRVPTWHLVGGAKYAPRIAWVYGRILIGIRPYTPGYTAQTAQDYPEYTWNTWNTSKYVKPHLHKAVNGGGLKGILDVYPLF